MTFLIDTNIISEIRKGPRNDAGVAGLGAKVLDPFKPIDHR